MSAARDDAAQAVYELALAIQAGEQCQYFLLCENPATTTLPHPVLGDVLACERCEAFAKS